MKIIKNNLKLKIELFLMLNTYKKRMLQLDYPLSNNIDLSFMKDSWNENMILDAIKAMNSVSEKRKESTWEYLKKNPIILKNTYIDSLDKMLIDVSNEMKFGHTITSFTYTMIIIQFISINGFRNFKRKYN